MTPEQLAKKRANDREAQRAIRERTRNTIDSLERRIRELESQQPFQEMQRVAAERDRALEENARLRQRLDAVAGIVVSGGSAAPSHPGALNGTFDFDDYIDPSLLTEDRAELAALSAQQSQLPPLQQQGQQQQQYPAQSGAAQHQEPHLHPALRSPVAYANSASSSMTTGSVYAAGESTLRKWSPSLDHPPQQQQQHYTSQAQTNGLGSYENSGAPAQATRTAAAPQTNGERLGLNFLLDGTSHARTSPTSAPAAPAMNLSGAEKPLHARLPMNSGPTCPLDSLLNDFISARRQLLQNGTPMREVIGPDYPSFIALYDPNTPQRNNCHPVSALLIDILSKFPDICNLPEKVAVLYIMFLVMRWSICPCEDCYQRLPEWVRPVAEQVEVPHPIWINHLPWYDNDQDPNIMTLIQVD